jgi:hypothetical protein
MRIMIKTINSAERYFTGVALKGSKIRGKGINYCIKKPGPVQDRIVKSQLLRALEKPTNEGWYITPAYRFC